MYDSHIVTTDLTPTVTNQVDAKIDEIAKDADDLGDWLYNQFFKTIENQVINSTSDNEPVLTRRSGVELKRKSKRRSRKRWKKLSKKSKHKKKGLKRKLLRITEDDSLFDSSSGSTSDEDSSSSSSESDTDTSSDSNRSDKDHGHKKIIIFNKKPKPPLPSFIFLPNMDTPFYPPIGLPPPPVIPMYPFVPVPPVAPNFPYSGFTESSDKAETNTSTTASPSPLPATPSTKPDSNGGTTTTTVTSSVDNVSTPESASSTPATEDEPATDKPSFRSRDSSLYGKILNSKNKQAQRNKLLQKLKDKINRRNKFNQMRQFTDDYLDTEEPLIGPLPKSNFGRQLQSNAIEEEMPMEDVDFKYLTELIHRVDFNNTRKPPQYPINVKIPVVGRRSFYTDQNILPGSIPTYLTEGPHRTRTKEPDNTYYSNLGRQIAAMIRKIDTNGERQIDIEVEKQNSQIPGHPVFNENNYASRTFWERSVRSPLTTYFEPRDSKFTYLNHSNENLFNLENIVEVAVTTNPPLSLQEIENIINKMEHSKPTVKKPNNSVITMPSRKSLNVDLLITNPKTKSWNRNIKSNVSTVTYENIPPRDNFYRFLINNDRKPTLSTFVPTIKTNSYKGPLDTHNKKPTRKPQTFNDNALKIPMMGYIKFINNLPTLTTTKRPVVHRLNPVPYHTNGNSNRKIANYFTNSKQYVYEGTVYPYFSTILGKYNQPVARPSKPSYFHHELHHFDYFDE
ncbi:hypothetical protein O3G_MSEX002754 [Manduca sexta]|nr:hypothetical protein O3G_MSEX002754 [Manduca sexta]